MNKTRRILSLIEEYQKKHNCVSGEEIYQNDTMQEDGLELVCDIIEIYTEDMETE